MMPGVSGAKSRRRWRGSAYARGMHPATRALHPHASPAPGTPTAGSIVQTAAYELGSAERAAALFGLVEAGSIYARMDNPTWDELVQRLTRLEAAHGGQVFASGLAAIHATVLTLARAGDNILVSPYLYGGTQSLLHHTMSACGIEVRVAPDAAAIGAHADARTRMMLCESVANPRLNLAPLPALAEASAHAGIPLVVDNTIPTPVLCQPAQHGAAIVIHSLTKWIGGHGAAVGGAVLDTGRFDWQAHPGLLAEPDPAYGGRRWSALGVDAFCARLTATTLRNTGASLAPFHAWLFLQGLESLAVRMERHGANAHDLATRLGEDDRVSVVWTPHHTTPALAQDLLAGPVGMIALELPSRAQGACFIDALTLFRCVANIGDARSLAIHPASTTHSQLTDAQLAQAGIPPGLVRLSVGLEHVEDLWEDLDQALAAACTA